MAALVSCFKNGVKMLGNTNELIEIGKIVGIHGLKGDIKIYPWCDTPQEIISAERLFLKNEEFKLYNKRMHKNVILAQIQGVRTPEQARVYINKIIYIPRSDIKLKPGQFLIIDLIGLTVVNNQKEEQIYGTVTDVLKTGSNDVYVIKNSQGKEYLIPAIKEVVNTIDIENKIIKITPMKGMFNDEN